MIKAYASYFVSYLLTKIKDENISNIILFGSVAQNQATKNSDVDIFIEIRKKTKKFKEKISQITKEFYQSREALLFKNKGIDNKINIITGKLNEWENLKKSIESTGIVLYGSYIPSKKVKGKKYSIFFWDKIEKNRGAFLNKIYGFKIHNKKHQGILERFEGKKLGKSSIMIPVEHREEIIKLIKHHKVHSKIIEVYE